jgi:phosphoheptose isomerase
MKVKCDEIEMYPVAELDADAEDIAHALADKYNKERPQGPCVYWSQIPSVIDVTQEEFDEYARLIERVNEMSDIFIARVRENEAALRASGIYPERAA